MYKDPEKRKAYAKAWRKANLEKVKTYGALWREINLKRKTETDAAWVANNHEKRIKSVLAWKDANPEKVRAQKAKRRAITLSASGYGVTGEQWKQILEAAGGVCSYCGEQKENLTMDHIIPLMRGGEHDVSNITVACVSCNSSKGVKLLHEWKKLKQ